MIQCHASDHHLTWSLTWNTSLKNSHHSVEIPRDRWPPFGSGQVGFKLYFPHSLLICGWIWLASPIGQPLFTLSVTCVYFVPKHFLSLKGSPSTKPKILNVLVQGHNKNLQNVFVGLKYEWCLFDKFWLSWKCLAWGGVSSDIPLMLPGK